MKKRNVFVHVKTIEECKELYDVLKENNEKIHEQTELGLKTGYDIDGDPQLRWPYIYLIYPDVWCGHHPKPSTQEVTIKELNKILSNG